jgi:type IV pilus assembly protein PilY1
MPAHPASLTRRLLLTSSLVVIAAASSAQVPLADQPVFASVNVPGNLALALSVEFPTAISVAHPNRTYSSANTYIGYFDPAKCYSYRYTDGTGIDNYFYPDGAATNRTCSGKWSGNYLNWASMQTIDPFRWALTGGYRVIDTSTLTVLEKAWATNQGGTGNFPDSSVSSSTVVAGATPFTNASSINTRIWALGNKIRFTTPSTGGANGASFSARYYNNKTQSSPVVLSRTEGYVNFNIAGEWPPGVNTTNMSANWTGSVKAPTNGTYKFKMRGDDGVRLSVRVNNGVARSINNDGWKDQAAADYYLDVPGVNANDTLNISMEYYQGGGGAEVSLQWQPPGATRYTTVGRDDAVDLYATTATHYNPANALQNGTLYEAFVRVKVCDPAAKAEDREANCTAYGSSSFKPTGLMQKYSDKIRYSAFGYLNDSNINRDGGVLRAKQKFIAPTRPVPGGIPVANTDAAEWDASTGVMVTNPDKKDADASGVANSGVMNYLNKFGQITPGTYKTYDPVGELYYAVQRYFRKLGNVPAWTNNATATQTDGFPVITSWDDPVQYSCQRNFILGIGDVNTHADRNLPGASGSSEPTKPTEVSNDGVSAYDWTNRVGKLQGLGSELGAVQGYNGCCNNNGALMAGLAYWANTNDIRSDLADTQTIQTYWLDVLEYQTFKPNNQFYLAAKFGGFTPPSDYSDATATASQFANDAATKSWWATTKDTTPDGAPRPDNYYTADRAGQMVDGLTKAFSSIASQLSAYSTSFSTSSPQFSTLGLASYATRYDAKTWTGDLEASLATLDPKTGKPSLDKRWTLAEKLATQTSRNIVTYDPAKKTGIPFNTTSLSTEQLSLLDPSYTASSDASDYVNYVRGDRKNERSSTAKDSTKAYRDRATLVGDIVNAKSRPVGPPSAAYSATFNPGYDKFKTDHASRTPMVYAGSNAGMLHAVNGSLTGTDAGKEVFAYIPSVVIAGPTGTPSVNGLASVGNPEFLHRFLVDAPPIDVDVDLGRTQGGSGTDWRTLLVGGLGKGGKAIYALDITKPTSVTDETTAATKVMWEFTDADLGYTYGQPIALKTRKWGWVIVTGSGYNNANGKGYFFFINPRTGERLEKVEVPCDTCSSANQAGLAHVNAFIVDMRDGTADAIYGGDLMGNIWRLDVTGTSAYPTPVHFAKLTGSDDKVLPITTKPLPVVQPGTNRRYVTVGTGRLLDSSDLNSGQAQRFFAILDGTNAAFSKASDLPSGAAFPLTVRHMVEQKDLSTKLVLDLRSHAGWYLDLGVSSGGPGWRVLSDPTSYYGTVTFAATAPSSGNANACSPNGNSRLYAVDLGSGKCALEGSGASCYVSPPEGIIIDTEVVGDPPCTTDACKKDKKNKRRVVYGTDRGVRDSNELSTPTALGLQRLNWREIIVNN